MLLFSWSEFNAIVAQEVCKEIFCCGIVIKKVLQRCVLTNYTQSSLFIECRVQKFFRVVYLKGTFLRLLFEPFILIKLLRALLRVIFKQREISFHACDFIDYYNQAAGQITKNPCAAVKALHRPNTDANASHINQFFSPNNLTNCRLL